LPGHIIIEIEYATITQEIETSGRSPGKKTNGMSIGAGRYFIVTWAARVKQWIRKRSNKLRLTKNAVISAMMQTHTKLFIACRKISMAIYAPGDCSSLAVKYPWEYYTTT
jgi:hypothetical protein